tara:strand:- start:668 stop:847 length:180 start_codon:yes stop_codon:yes gene_type:complete
MANKKTNSEKHKFLHPPKPPSCMSAMMRKGMSRSQARKHCDDLWKKEESYGEGKRTVNV